METLAKADIFFFVTTIAVVVVSIFLIILLTYTIFALRRLRRIVDIVEKNIDTASEEVKEIMTHIKESFLFNLVFGRKRNHKKRPK